MKRRMKAFAAIGLTVVMTLGQTMVVSAAPTDSIAAIQNEQAYTTAELESLQASITELENKKAALTSEIDEYQAQLVTTIASINSLEESITQKMAELEQTEQDLAAAKEDQAAQYDAMKKRIQYIYENGGNTGWAGVVLGETNLSNTLNSVDDTNQLYEYDRDELTNYMEAALKVAELETQKVNEKSQLETMKTEQESGKAVLESMITEAQAQSDDFDVQLASAEEIASQYQALIAEQNAQIAELTAQQAALEAAAAAESADTNSNASAGSSASISGAVNGNSSADSGSDTYYVEPVDDDYVTPIQDNSSNDTPSNDDTVYYDDSTADTSSDTSYIDTSNTDTSSTVSYDSVSGQAVVNYALQFLGNPYVWGGTSLTNGTDCSGFVQSVYAHFGVSLSRTTYTQMYDGVGVSYAEAQPGDIIVYDGHVGIYMGGGQIVHAANEALGITIGNATYTTILAVRRFFT